MAFPVIEATNEGATTPASTSHTVPLPTGIVSGDLLLVFFRGTEASDIAFPGGWTELFDDQSDPSDDSTALAWRKADGTEGASITVTTLGNSQRACFLSWRISGAADPTVTPPEFATLATGTSTNPNPGSLTPAGGAKDYLWLALAGHEGESGDPPSAFPANYTLSQIAIRTGTAGVSESNCGVAGAGRNLNATTEDPGAYTIGISNPWTATTVAVSPAAAGGTTFFQTIAATSVGSAALADVVIFPVALVAVAVGTGVLSRVVTFGKALAATALGVATLTKGLFVSLAAVATGVASLTKGMFTTLAATAVGAATLGAATVFARALVATATGIAGIAALVVAGVTMSATAVGVAVLTALEVTGQTIAAIAIGVANLTATFIAGTGEVINDAVSHYYAGWRRWRR